MYIARAWSSQGACIRAFRQSTTFPAVVGLHVEKTWDDTDREDLRSCAMRGLTEVETAAARTMRTKGELGGLWKGELVLNAFARNIEYVLRRGMETRKDRGAPAQRT